MFIFEAYEAFKDHHGPFNKGDNFCGFPFAFLHAKYSEKGSTQKGKNLLPLRSKFFPLRIDPVSEGQINLKELLPLKVSYLLLTLVLLNKLRCHAFF